MNGYIESDHQVNYRQWNSAMRDAGFSLPNGLPLNSEAEADELHRIVIGIDKPSVDEIEPRRWADEMEEMEADWKAQVLELRGGG